MAENNAKYQTSDYVRKRRRLSGAFFEVALPNEYLVEIGTRNVKPVLGGRRLRLFRKFIRVPASVQTLYFSTDNANVDYQGIGIEGYASWRIDPSAPEVAIRTLDFFDENDPMARTNKELQTICVEAVRHVIANMSIDDALKKKDEIGENLRAQLKEVEKKWGIIFDQVGIEKVRIMSSKLFENLQARFRDELRLEVERKRISTDRDIAREENILREKTGLDAIETDKKINLSQVETESRVKEMRIDESAKIAARERDVREEEMRKELKFMAEKEQKQHDLAMLTKELQLKQLESEKKLLAGQEGAEKLRGSIEKLKLEIETLRQKLEQSYTPELLTSTFLEKLPELYKALKIEHYTVLDSGGKDGITPASKFLGEILALLKTADLSSIFGNKTAGQSAAIPDKKPGKTDKG